VWEVNALGLKIKKIVGVLEVGLFHGINGAQAAASIEEGGGQKPVAAYSGWENGEVEIREAREIARVKSIS
jgi:ribose 5-phosphate isomerase A